MIVDLDGFWKLDKEAGKVFIFYNTDKPVNRQHFTKPHELVHFSQSIDIFVLDFFDELYLDPEFPNALIPKLLEKATDKATAMYIMPNDYFVKKFKETRDIQIVSNYFQVSVQTAVYRLKECFPVRPQLQPQFII